MKHLATIFAVLAALGLAATGVHAEEKSNVNDAASRVREQLPAEPPQASTGTVKGPTLSKPDPSYKPQPKYPETPKPERNLNPTGDKDIQKGIDDYKAGEHPSSGTRTEK